MYAYVDVPIQIQITLFILHRNSAEFELGSMKNQFQKFDFVAPTQAEMINIKSTFSNGIQSTNHAVKKFENRTSLKGAQCKVQNCRRQKYY